MQLDEKALEAAAKVVAGYFGERHTETFYRGAAADIITAYLAALEPEDGVKIEGCLALDSTNRWVLFGEHNALEGWNKIKATENLGYHSEPHQYRIVVATVRPWTQPDEPVTRGREVG